jgi:Ca-activated chloride channel family protein
MKTSNAERLLHDQPVPPPPEGLAESIKNEIPDTLEIHPALLETDRVVPWHRRPTVRLAVAAIFVIALTAAVSWRMRRGPVLPSLTGDAQRQPTERIDVRRLQTGTSERSSLDETGVDSTLDRESLDQTQPLGYALSRRFTGETGAEVGAETASAASTVRTGVKDATSAPADAVRAGAPVESESLSVGNERTGATVNPEAQEAGDVAAEEVTANFNRFSDQVLPNLEVDGGGAKVTEEAVEQAMERSFEGEVTVTGSLIPRADLTTVVSPVVDSAPVRDSSEVDSSDRELEKRIAFLSESARLRRQRDTQAPSTGGTHEPNDQPYGDVFFREAGVNPFIDTEDDHFSTFGLEVDTGSYNVVKRYLSDGHLPPREAVRAEEIVNAFDYGDASPTSGDFALTAEGAPSPFGEGSRYEIVRFGVTARAVDGADRPPAVLTFVVDVSGSMNREDRLVMVKRALYALLENLREEDRVGLVVYGSRGEVLLEPTTDHDRIARAIDQLRAEGSTNAEEGLVLAYELADRFRDEELINRVILCSDGVANVGRTGPESILERIKGWADNGIELTTVGFGMGNYNDVLMEQLADTGDGRYAYVDTLDEAHKLFVEELTGTLLTIGSEAKAQVEFNPEVVSRYRLIGYENRDIADEDFRNDAVDAGEIGAGLTATAVYEIKLHRDLRRHSREPVATLRVRYRPFKSDRVREIKHELRLRDIDGRWDKASPSLRLATLVAEYAEILKGSYWAREGDMREVLNRARELAPAFARDERFAEWLELVEQAADLIDEQHDDEADITE